MTFRFMNEYMIGLDLHKTKFLKNKSKFKITNQFHCGADNFSLHLHINHSHHQFCCYSLTYLGIWQNIGPIASHFDSVLLV